MPMVVQSSGKVWLSRMVVVAVDDAIVLVALLVG